MTNELLAFVFGEESLKKLQLKAGNWAIAAAGIIILSAALTLPTDGFNEKTLPTIALALIGFTGAIAACFAFAKILGSKKNARDFAGIAAVMGAGGALIVLAVAGIASAANFLLNNEAFSSLALSLIPFYSFVLFGWACETASDLKGAKGILLGLFATASFVILHLLLGS